MHAELLKLINEWREYVGIDHHKNRDLYWYIEAEYGPEEVRYSAYHNGYVYREDPSGPYSTYEKAREALISMIKRAIRDQKPWVDEVIGGKKGDWDELQVQQAEKWYELWGDSGF